MNLLDPNMLSPHRKLSSLFRGRRKIMLVWTFSLLYLLLVFKGMSFFIAQENDEQFLMKKSEKVSSNINNYCDVNNNAWTRISDSVHIYSAHLDTRIKQRSASQIEEYFQKEKLVVVRIIGMKRVPSMKQVIKVNPLKWLRMKDETHFGNEYYCKIFTSNNKNDEKMYSFRGEILSYTIIEEGLKRFASTYFNCYVNSTKLKEVIEGNEKAFVAIYPVSVSDYPDKLIQVETVESDSNKIMKVMSTANVNVGIRGLLSICVRPLFGPMDELIKLVQFVSYYYSMGVTRFNFYDLSISPRIRKYLTDLRKLGNISVSLQQWNLPTGNISELWDFGTIAALNDCLYRNMGSNHVIFVDIDEFIVPQMEGHQNLHDLINFYENTNPYFQELLIRNTFFCKEFCLEENKLNYLSNNNSIKQELATNPTSIIFPINSCRKRTKRVWNAKLRAKFIVKPLKIIAVGHHMVHKHVDQEDKRLLRSMQASKDVVLLNHYRECKSISFNKLPVIDRLTTYDDKILRFENKMTRLLP